MGKFMNDFGKSFSENVGTGAQMGSDAIKMRLQSQLKMNEKKQEREWEKEENAEKIKFMLRQERAYQEATPADKKKLEEAADLGLEDQMPSLVTEVDLDNKIRKKLGPKFQAYPDLKRNEKTGFLETNMEPADSVPERNTMDIRNLSDSAKSLVQDELKKKDLISGYGSSDYDLKKKLAGRELEERKLDLELAQEEDFDLYGKMFSREELAQAKENIKASHKLGEPVGSGEETGLWDKVLKGAAYALNPFIGPKMLDAIRTGKITKEDEKMFMALAEAYKGKNENPLRLKQLAKKMNKAQFNAFKNYNDMTDEEAYKALGIKKSDLTKALLK